MVGKRLIPLPPGSQEPSFCPGDSHHGSGSPVKAFWWATLAILAFIPFSSAGPQDRAVLTDDYCRRTIHVGFVTPPWIEDFDTWKEAFALVAEGLKTLQTPWDFLPDLVSWNEWSGADLDSGARVVLESEQPWMFASKIREASPGDDPGEPRTPYAGVVFERERLLNEATGLENRTLDATQFRYESYSFLVWNGEIQAPNNAAPIGFELTSWHFPLPFPESYRFQSQARKLFILNPGGAGEDTANIDAVSLALPNNYTRFYTEGSDFVANVDTTAGAQALADVMIGMIADQTTKNRAWCLEETWRSPLIPGLEIPRNELAGVIVVYGSILLYCMFCQACGFEKITKEDREKTGRTKICCCCTCNWCYCGCLGSLRLLYFQTLIYLEARLQSGFRGIGRMIVKRPRPFVWVGLSVGLISLLWIVIYCFSVEPSTWFNTDVQSLWAAPSSTIYATGKFLAEDFPFGSFIPRSKAAMILTSKSGGNVLTKENLETLLQLETDLEAHKDYIDRAEFPACYFLKLPDNCVRSSPLDYWRPEAPFNMTLEPFDEDPDALFNKTLNPLAVTAFGTPLYRNNVFNNMIPTDICALGAPYKCKSLNATDEEDQEEAVECPPGSTPNVCIWSTDEEDYNTGEFTYQQWYKNYVANEGVVRAMRLTYYRIPLWADGSRRWTNYFLGYELPEDADLQIEARYLDDDLYTEVIQSSIPPVGMLVMVALTIFAYITKVFLKRKDLVESRATLAWLGLFGTMLSLCFGFWILMILGGEQLSMTVIVVPVVIASIGVDDMFLLADALDETDDALPIAKRIPEAIQAAGLAMSMTTVTDALAFLLGALSEVEAVRVMSLFAFVCILTDFTWQVTMFVGVMTIDTKRRQAGKKDFHLFKGIFLDYPEVDVTKPPPKPEGTEDEGAEEGEGLLADSGPNGHGNAEGGDGDHHHEGRGCLGSCLGPCLVAPCCRQIVLALFLGGMIASGFITVFSLTGGLPLASVVSADSEVGKYLALEPTLWGSPHTVPVDLVHVAGNGANISVGYLDESIQFPDSLLWESGLPSSTLSPQFGHSLLAWEDAFEFWATNKSLDIYPEQFYPLLDQFMTEEGEGTIDLDVLRDGEVYTEGEYVASKAWMMMHVPHSDANLYIVYSLFYGWIADGKWFATDLALLEPTLTASGQLLSDVSWTALIVAVVAIFFLQHPSAAFLLVLSFVSVVVYCLAGMSIMGIPLNVFTQVSFVIALGLSIDYLAHIAHGYIMAPGSRKDKAVHSLAVHGPAVWNGMATTALGMFMLRWLGHVAIVGDFARIVLLVQFVGIFHAFCCLTPLFAVAGPRTVRNPVTQVLVDNDRAAVRGSIVMEVDLADVLFADIRNVTRQQAAAADEAAIAATIEFEALENLNQAATDAKPGTAEELPAPSYLPTAARTEGNPQAFSAQAFERRFEDAYGSKAPGNGAARKDYRTEAYGKQLKLRKQKVRRRLARQNTANSGLGATSGGASGSGQRSSASARPGSRAGGKKPRGKSSKKGSKAKNQ